MNNFFLAIAAASLFTPLAHSDDLGNADHSVNGPVADCLKNPTQACAFQASMTTAIEERLSIERAKVLTAVGRALAETGKFDEARLTLNMALEEAESSNISFAVEAKLLDLAPVLAMIGDIEKTISLADNVRSVNGRARVISLAAEMAASVGNIEGAMQLSQSLANERRSIWVSLKVMKILVHGGFYEGLNEYADSIFPLVEAMKRPGDKLLAMVRLSTIYAAIGELEKSNSLQDKSGEVRNSFASYSLRARVASAQLEYATIIGGNEMQEALQVAMVAETRIRGNMEKSLIADEMGPAFAFSGHVDQAADFIKYYDETLAKSNFLKRVSQFVRVGENDGFSRAIQSVLTLSREMENGYEADEVRTNLIFAARATGNLDLATEIALSMQDDDNAARALALLIPMLKS